MPGKRRIGARVGAGAFFVVTLATVAVIADGAHAPQAAPAIRQDVPERVAALPKPAPAAAPVASQAPAASADAGYTIKRVLPIDGPMHHGDWHWDEKGAPDGPTVITVDLKAQVLSVFRDGYEIGTAVVVYGADMKPTPLGVYPVTQKDADHVSNIYDAPMPYMLRLTNDGVSIHGSEVEDGTMTHGCIGVPNEFARRLFGQVRLGDKVIVTNGETLKLGGAITAA